MRVPLRAQIHGKIKIACRTDTRLFWTINFSICSLHYLVGMRSSELMKPSSTLNSVRSANLLKFFFFCSFDSSLSSSLFTLGFSMWNLCKISCEWNVYGFDVCPIKNQLATEIMAFGLSKSIISLIGTYYFESIGVAMMHGSTWVKIVKYHSTWHRLTWIWWNLNETNTQIEQWNWSIDNWTRCSRTVDCLFTFRFQTEEYLTQHKWATREKCEILLCKTRIRLSYVLNRSTSSAHSRHKWNR